jgi:hypothetical protein
MKAEGAGVSAVIVEEVEAAESQQLVTEGGAETGAATGRSLFVACLQLKLGLEAGA